MERDGRAESGGEEVLRYVLCRSRYYPVDRKMTDVSFGQLFSTPRARDLEVVCENGPWHKMLHAACRVLAVHGPVTSKLAVLEVGSVSLVGGEGEAKGGRGTCCYHCQT